MDIAAEIRAEAARHNIGTATLAERTGMSPATVSRKTNGHSQITVEDLIKFAAALDTTATDLISRVEQPSLPAAA